MTTDHCTLTIRLIRSFEHRNIRNLVLNKVVDVEKWTTDDLKNEISRRISTAKNLPPPFKAFDYDTLKIEHQAFGAKTNDPCINTENDRELILKSKDILSQRGIRNETEISYFKLEDYERYKNQKKLVQW